jgi:hypothetical protein
MDHPNVTFQLEEHGWAVFTLDAAPHYLSRDVSYIGKGLEEISSAFVDIATSFGTVQFTLYGEPVSHRFERVYWPGSSLSLKVFRLDDTEEFLFEIECDFEDFVRQIYREMKKTLREHGFSGYRESWLSESFPLTDLLALTRYLDWSNVHGVTATTDMDSLRHAIVNPIPVTEEYRLLGEILNEK